jgi:hypothetical protein
VVQLIVSRESGIGIGMSNKHATLVVLLWRNAVAHRSIVRQKTEQEGKRGWYDGIPIGRQWFHGDKQQPTDGSLRQSVIDFTFMNGFV